MDRIIRIGTRDSELAVWQARSVQQLLAGNKVASELVFVKSEGDLDLITPLYDMGVQGIFTKTLDTALLNDRIDIAVHSMKDVPTVLPKGIVKAAVLKRASYKDIFVFKDRELIRDWLLEGNTELESEAMGTIATSSIRRKAQWMHRYPNHKIENLRGNVNTRLKKVSESDWHGAIFAAAGLERINLRPNNSIDLNWMLPAPAQGAIIIVCKSEDLYCLEACCLFNDRSTELCTKIERDFLHGLKGGCSTPVSALAEIQDGVVTFEGNLCSLDGKEIIKVSSQAIETENEVGNLGKQEAEKLLQNENASVLLEQIRNAK